MANTKLKRSEVDRWTGSAIGHLSPPTPEQQRAIDEIKAQFAKKKAASKQPKKK